MWVVGRLGAGREMACRRESPAGWLVVQPQEFVGQGLPCQCNKIMVQEVQEYSHTKD